MPTEVIESSDGHGDDGDEDEDDEIEEEGRNKSW